MSGSTFKRRRKVYKLDFSGTEYDGLVVKAGGLTTGEYLEIIGLAVPDESDESAETDKMLQMFAKHLKSWNLISEDDDDTPVPATYEGLKSNDLAMNTAIINAWTTAIGQVSEETAGKSSDTSPAPEESIPTEML